MVANPGHAGGTVSLSWCLCSALILLPVKLWIKSPPWCSHARLLPNKGLSKAAAVSCCTRQESVRFFFCENWSLQLNPWLCTYIKSVTRLLCLHRLCFWRSCHIVCCATFMWKTDSRSPENESEKMKLWWLTMEDKGPCVCQKTWYGPHTTDIL